MLFLGLGLFTGVVSWDSVACYILSMSFGLLARPRFITNMAALVLDYSRISALGYGGYL